MTQPTQKLPYTIGEKHNEYGWVVAMLNIQGEKYRMFINKNNVVSLIPLDSILKLHND